MNNPEHILVDVFADIVTAVKTALNLPALNYQYGYIQELNVTLTQMGNNPDNAKIKFPCVYLVQPFTIQRGIQQGVGAGLYGLVSDLRILILNDAKEEWKAADRMENNFKPTLYPIYRELLNQIELSVAFAVSSKDAISHKFVDRYYWGDTNGKKSILDDIVDCVDLQNITLSVYNNPNCLPSKSFR